jgi:hypothetical protein
MSIRYNLIADPFSPLLCGAAAEEEKIERLAVPRVDGNWLL